MAKPEWGTKRTCPSCGARFYDLNKEIPLTCPKCETLFEPETVLKPRRGRPEEEPKPVAKAEPETEDDLEDDLLDDDADDDITAALSDDDDDDVDVGVDVPTEKTDD